MANVTREQLGATSAPIQEVQGSDEESIKANHPKAGSQGDEGSCQTDVSSRAASINPTNANPVWSETKTREKSIIAVFFPTRLILCNCCQRKSRSAVMIVHCILNY